MSDTSSNLGLWLSFIKTYRLIQADLAHKLSKEFSLSLPQFQLLAQLAGYKEGRTMSELADALLMSNGNITGLTTRLVQKNWIEMKRHSEDKRVTYVLLSPDGEKKFKSILNAYELWVDDLFKTIPSEQASELRLVLRRIRPQSA